VQTPPPAHSATNIIRAVREVNKRQVNIVNFNITISGVQCGVDSRTWQASLIMFTEPITSEASHRDFSDDVPAKASK
jgi:hypothetical protein